MVVPIAGPLPTAPLTSAPYDVEMASHDSRKKSCG